MPTLRDLVDQVLVQLNEDTTSPVHYARSEILNALNEALGVVQRAALNSAANADLLSYFTVTKEIPLTRGTKQRLPASAPDKGAQFLRAYRVGDRALTQFTLALMDAIDPDWHVEMGNPRQYAPDPNPTAFWVYPAPTSSGQILVSYIKEPEALSESDDTPFDSKYDQALIDFALYRAYSKDTEYAGQDGRATAHYRAFKDGINGAG